MKGEGQGDPDCSNAGLRAVPRTRSAGARDRLPRAKRARYAGSDAESDCRGIPENRLRGETAASVNTRGVEGCGAQDRPKCEAGRPRRDNPPLSRSILPRESRRRNRLPGGSHFSSQPPVEGPYDLDGTAHRSPLPCSSERRTEHRARRFLGWRIGRYGNRNIRWDEDRSRCSGGG